MKPQQQDTDAKKQSHVFVQQPDGEQINIPMREPESPAKNVDAAKSQTAENTPTTHSGEVTSGEDA